MANVELVKAIRYKTNLSFKDINAAIIAVGTEDETAIIEHLKKQGVLKSAAKQGRETTTGAIFTYAHEMRIGVMVEIKCESDFVARGEDFQNLGKEVCLHIAAYQPKFVTAEEVSQDYINAELVIAKEKLLADGKPEDMIVKILEGMKNKMAKEVSLLSQPFLMNPEISTADHIAGITAKCGEKVEISKFIVFNLNG
jgi:elongation factor Ts